MTNENNRAIDYYRSLLFSKPLIQPSILDSLKPISPSEAAIETLSNEIIQFEKQLDQEHELGFRLVASSAGTVFHAESIEACGGAYLKFVGIDAEHQRVALIQHASQVSVLLVALKKRHEEPFRVGFVYSGNSNSP